MKMVTINLTRNSYEIDGNTYKLTRIDPIRCNWEFWGYWWLEYKTKMFARALSGIFRDLKKYPTSIVCIHTKKSIIVVCDDEDTAYELFGIEQFRS